MIRLLFIAMLVCFQAGSSFAVDAKFGTRAIGTWTDNLFFTADEAPGRQDEFTVRLSPWMSLEDLNGKVTWYARYQPSWEHFLDHEDLSGFDHDFDGRLTWQFSPKTSIRIDESFSRYRNVSRFNEVSGVDAADPAAVLLDIRSRFARNDLTAMLRHQLSKRGSVLMSGQYSTWDFSDEARADRGTFRLGANYRFALSKRLGAGAGISWNRQDVEASPTQDARVTEFYNASVLMDFAWDDTFTFDASIGPTSVRSDEKAPVPPPDRLVSRYPTRTDEDGVARFLDATTCPTLSDGTPFVSADCDALPGVSGAADTAGIANRISLFGELEEPAQTSTTFFADIGLLKEWSDWTFSLRYRREDDTTTGLGATSIIDIVTGRLTWKVTRRLSFELINQWTQREQESTFNQVVVGLDTPGCLSPGLLFLGDNCLFFTTAGAALAPLAAAQTTSLRAITTKRKTDLTTYRAILLGRYQINKRVAFFGRLFYYREKTSSNFGFQRQADQFTVWIGLDYEFEPIRF